MKILALILGVMLVCSQAFAITQEQLEQADQTLMKMQFKVISLRNAVNMARKGTTSEGLNLTTTQKDELKDKYVNEKAELVTLYQQLP